MGKSSAPPSELLEAARELEEELERFGKIARELEKEPLSSRKSLDRAGGSLARIADIEDGLAPAMSKLMAALNALRTRHEQQTENIKRRAEEIRQRSEVYRGLLERLGELLERTGTMNERLSTLSSGDKGKDELVAELESFLAQIGELTDATEALQRECKEVRFEDVAKQADGLSTQLGNARSKLARLQKELSR
jgi:methyl-accepting chemotaxis protein